MGKLNGKVAVITAATSGMALATAKLFVEEGAYVFITGRRQDKLDEAVKLIGKNVTGVQGDASSLADLDRLYESVKREKGKIDILFASAGFGEFAKLEEVTEEHFDKTFDLNVRGTLFTVQKALPLFNDNGSIFLLRWGNLWVTGGLSADDRQGSNRACGMWNRRNVALPLSHCESMGHRLHRVSEEEAGQSESSSVCHLRLSHGSPLRLAAIGC